jgi:hypothetical protein
MKWLSSASISGPFLFRDGLGMRRPALASVLVAPNFFLEQGLFRPEPREGELSTGRHLGTYLQRYANRPAFAESLSVPLHLPPLAEQMGRY